MTAARSTKPGGPAVLVPGKVFLAGEYAVLEGGVAVLAAVSRHARGRFVPGAQPSSPLIAETVGRASTALARPAPSQDRAQRGNPAASRRRSPSWTHGAPLVDTSAFAQGAVKLGLGSSAAATVAAAGAMFEHAGLSVTANRELLYQVADAAHRAAQGGVGSGADVAAAVHGGFVRFARPPGDLPRCRPLRPPPGLQMLVFWTGAPARTADLIEAVQRFAAADAVTYRRLIDRAKAAAHLFAVAFAGDDAGDVVVAADAYGDALAALGEAARIPIVTPAFQRVTRYARQLGGTAKPSGAGGGDVGVAFFADAAAATEFRARGPEGITVLELGLGAEGARRELEGSGAA